MHEWADAAKDGAYLFDGAVDIVSPAGGDGTIEFWEGGVLPSVGRRSRHLVRGGCVRNVLHSAKYSQHPVSLSEGGGKVSAEPTS